MARLKQAVYYFVRSQENMDKGMSLNDRLNGMKKLYDKFIDVYDIKTDAKNLLVENNSIRKEMDSLIISPLEENSRIKGLESRFRNESDNIVNHAFMIKQSDGRVCLNLEGTNYYIHYFSRKFKND